MLVVPIVKAHSTLWSDMPWIRSTRSNRKDLFSYKIINGWISTRFLFKKFSNNMKTSSKVDLIDIFSLLFRKLNFGYNSLCKVMKQKSCIVSCSPPSSSALLWPDRVVMKPWSRAQVSLVGHSCSTICCMLTPAARSCDCPSGVTMRSGWRSDTSRAISMKHFWADSRYGAQSVSACGQVSCTNRCGSHSAGSIYNEELGVRS